MLSSNLQPYVRASDSIILPDVQQLQGQYYSASFELMKLMPAKLMLDDAEQKGLLTPETTVVESSSGTFALGLAILCAERGYKLIIVGDDAIDSGLKNRLLDLGAHLDIVSADEGGGGIQQVRLNKLYSWLETEKNAFWPKQYENPCNPESYYMAAEHVLEKIGAVDYLVDSIGSGGSSQGMTKAMRMINPKMKLIGVDSVRSIIFGRQDGRRLLRGLGSSILPANVDYELFDQVHWLECAEGFFATRKLHREHQLFMGPTSGSTYLVGQWIADQYKDAKVLSIFPDKGHRYINTAYSDEWLKENDIFTEHVGTPLKLNHPSDPTDGWCYYDWNEQTYDQATGGAK